MIVDPSHNDDSMARRFSSPFYSSRKANALAPSSVMRSQKEPLLGSSSTSTPQDNPPSYDFATESGGPSIAHPNSDINNAYKPLIPFPPSPKLGQTQPLLVHHATGSSNTPYTPTGPMVYSYVNPTTGQHVASLLPPDHPEMICLQEGAHVPHTQYGLLGILAAVFWFPLGIGLCLLDRRVRCSRCGHVIDDGICG